jgi:FMN phosphatase YigB (HAD superfamily)
MPLRAAVFDLHGVLARVDPEYLAGIAEEFGLTLDEIMALFRGPAAVEDTLAGRKFDIAQVRVAMTAALPARLGPRTPEAANRLVGVYSDPEAIIPIAEMVDVLRDVRATGVPVGCLSNGPRGVIEQSWMPLLGDALPATIFMSGVEGVGKPEAAAFEAVAKALGVAPADCFFIDDTQHHVDGARAAGMQAMLFEGDAGAVRAELQTVGLLLGGA